MKPIVLLASIAAVFASCTESNQAQIEAIKANDQAEIMISDLDKAFSNNVMNGNWDAVANAYHSEAFVLPPGDTTIRGREAILTFWEPRPGFRITDHQLMPTEIRVDGEIGYDVGTYRIAGIRQDSLNFGPSFGQYLVVWKKENGDWKIYADAWSRFPQNN